MNIGDGYEFECSGSRQDVILSNLKKSDFVPEDGSELFVKKIPRAATAQDLLDFFSTAGTVLQLKMMTSERGGNRGFGYVTFVDSSTAKTAIDILSHQKFLNKTHLKIERSLNNRRIFVGGLPTNKTKDDVWRELIKLGVENIVDIIMYRNYADRRQNRGFVFVEFRTHTQAAAFRSTYKNKLELWKQPMIMDWSIPIRPVEEDVLNQVKVIFLRNLDVWEAPAELQRKIKDLAGSSLERVYKFKNYAFVHVNSRENAEILKRKLEEFYKNTFVEIEWSIPPSSYNNPDYRLEQVFSKSRSRSRASSSSDSNISHVSFTSDIEVSATHCYKDEIEVPASGNGSGGLVTSTSDMFQSLASITVGNYHRYLLDIENLFDLKEGNAYQSTLSMDSGNSSLSSLTPEPPVRQQAEHVPLWEKEFVLGNLPFATDESYTTECRDPLGSYSDRKYNRQTIRAADKDMHTNIKAYQAAVTSVYSKKLSMENFLLNHWTDTPGEMTLAQWARLGLDEGFSAVTYGKQPDYGQGVIGIDKKPSFVKIKEYFINQCPLEESKD